jgi:SUMO ligase MMS21 Smc5/6 complex component
MTSRKMIGSNSINDFYVVLARSSSGICSFIGLQPCHVQTMGSSIHGSAIHLLSVSGKRFCGLTDDHKNSSASCEKHQMANCI